MRRLNMDVLEAHVLEDVGSRIIAVPTVAARVDRRVRQLGAATFVLVNAEPVTKLSAETVAKAWLVLDWELSHVRHWHVHDTLAWWFPTTWWLHARDCSPCTASVEKPVFMGTVRGERRRLVRCIGDRMTVRRATTMEDRDAIARSAPCQVNLKSCFTGPPYLEVQRITSIGGVAGIPCVTHVDHKSEWLPFLREAIVLVDASGAEDIARALDTMDLAEARSSSQSWWSAFTVDVLVRFMLQVQYGLACSITRE